jgi:predicted RNA-binding protein with PIN domain
VIRRDPDLAGVEAAGLPAGRAALLRLVAGAAQTSGDTFTVVFDGAPGFGEGAGGRVENIYTRPPEKADDAIVALARRFAADAIVVSSDRAVSDGARRAGATAVSAERFLAAIAARDDAAPDQEEDDDDAPARTKRGNPRRASAEERAARRVLRRLSGSRP